MFKVSTEREEKAYRLGYVEGWAEAELQLCQMTRRMNDYRVITLWPWLRAKTPKISEGPSKYFTEYFTS